MKNGKSRYKWTKSKGYSLTFFCFLPLFQKLKSRRKVKAIALRFSWFLTSFSKIEKSTKNGRKVKAI
jgi:hypothetical protein